MRLLRRFRRAGCSSGGEWPLPPKGTALGCCAGDAQRGPRCCRSGGWKHTLKTHVRVSVHFSKCFCGSSFLSPGETAAAAARRLGCCALVVQHGHHCCRSPFWGARKTHVISRIFSLCVRDLSSVANPVALTRVDVTTRLDLRSSWSWLVCSQCCVIVFKCASIAPNLPCPSLHIILSWLRRVLVFTSWNFVSPEVLLLADECRGFFAAESAASSYH